MSFFLYQKARRALPMAQKKDLQACCRLPVLPRAIIMLACVCIGRIGQCIWRRVHPHPLPTSVPALPSSCFLFITHTLPTLTLHLTTHAQQVQCFCLSLGPSQDIVAKTLPHPADIAFTTSTFWQQFLSHQTQRLNRLYPSSPQISHTPPPAGPVPCRRDSLSIQSGNVRPLRTRLASLSALRYAPCPLFTLLLNTAIYDAILGTVLPHLAGQARRRGHVPSPDVHRLADSES
jgi:hypothetical protein